MLDKALALFRKFNIDYGEFRDERETSSSISLRDEETSVSTGDLQGLSVRMLVKGSWGFASSDDPALMGMIFERAYKLATITRGKSRVDSVFSSSGTYGTKTKTPLADVAIETKMKDMCELQGSLSGECIFSRSVRYSDSICEERFVNTSGSECKQKTSRVYLAMMSVA
ncbi:MAG: DNA gyrase modulator, partial [Candidatus Micrarchaeota archaeon]